MANRRILVPIDGTERSMRSFDFVKSIFPKESTEIILMNVKELVIIDGMTISDELRVAEEIGKEILDSAEKELEGYSVNKYFTFGYAGDEIVKKAKEENVDFIVMTKSTKKGLTRIIGSVTVSVVKHAKCIVMIVPE
jgi:nucleotide-binding universal stress UspA family protein